MNKIFLLGLFVCLISLSCAQNLDDEKKTTTKTTTTTTTTATTTTTTTTFPTTQADVTTKVTTQAPTTEKPTTDKPTTEKPTTTTTSVVTTESPQTTTTSAVTTTTTKVQPTTVTSTTTTTTTTLPTTTQAPVPVFNFTIPKNTSEPTCLRAKFSLNLDIGYKATLSDNSTSNLTLGYLVQSIDEYDGECNPSYNTLSFKFQNGWSILFNYTLVNSVYQLDRVQFTYIVDKSLFLNASDSELGKHTVDQSNLNEFSANKDNSFKCTSKTTFDVNGVQFDFTNYQAEPFSGSDKTDFDTAVECAGDMAGTSKLVPIIVGSALSVMVVLVLIAYVIGRRKHRPGYQQV